MQAFERAWENLTDRQSMLRTSFDWEKLKNPVQLVSAKVTLPLERHDWRGLAPQEQEERVADSLKADRERGFDLSRAPLSASRLSASPKTRTTCLEPPSHTARRLVGAPSAQRNIPLLRGVRSGEEPRGRRVALTAATSRGCAGRT